MSVSVAFHFPWKRYHATPWGHYVNEGLVEIPPSPWRILRALYSVWKLRAPDLPSDTVHTLLERLANPPEYTLPPYQLSHTRHYLPDSKHRSGAPSTDLALDAFAVLSGDATITAHWLAVELTPDQTAALQRLAASLPYLGRADSLCHATFSPAASLPGPEKPRATMLMDDQLPRGMVQTSVLAPAPPFDLDALTTESTQVRRAKLLYPPGSRLVPYAVTAPQQPPAPTRRRRRSRIDAANASAATGKITTVRLSLNGTPQPRATDTIAVTDVLRAAALKRLGPVAGASNLVGKDTDGQPLKGQQHAHYIGLISDGLLSGLAIWAPGGLTDEELAAIDALAEHRIGVPNQVRGPRNLHVRINAYGTQELLPAELTGPSRTWTSSTPFLPSRWRPRNTAPDEYLINEVNRELTQRGFRAAIKITELPGRDWVTYRRHRPTRLQHSNRSTPNRTPYGLRLDFPEPVNGPIALGDLSHFGLGLFTATT